MKYPLLFVALLLSTVSLPSTALVSEWAEFEIHNGHIVIPVEIQGVNGHAVLDSGANINAINELFINSKELDVDRGRKIRISGVFGTETKSMINNVNINLFGVDKEFDSMVEMTLPGSYANILLGKPFLDHFVIQIDYPGERLRLITRDSIDLKKHQNVTADIDPVSGLPLIQAQLNGEEEAWLLLDTGNNSGILLRRSVATRHSWLEKFPSDLALSSGINKTAIMEGFSIPSLQLGPFELENVLITVPSAGHAFPVPKSINSHGSRALKSKTYEGILGFDVLRHFILTLDLKKGYAHFALPE
ncbi:hypothetical protein GCM10011369_22910 [Neiella marina]|uniref:Signal protein PDZ n=1 Tax=Neiella marina TaxID=508461 RepID=A0A8J2U5U9_9GAMM|nr:pepsin/retropepsin-like aspartic protease family protein [Neiella marina]GGA80415.1 hypothetical protein GCM10011369_22910 [Neiella marina]